MVYIPMAMGCTWMVVVSHQCLLAGFSNNHGIIIIIIIQGHHYGCPRLPCTVSEWIGLFSQGLVSIKKQILSLTSLLMFPPSTVVLWCVAIVATIDFHSFWSNTRPELHSLDHAKYLGFGGFLLAI